ncbi:dihydroorotate dehydrogenase B (NAD(+)), electron transfer subunit [Spirochaetia bacterium]|nr:dihydroorotate dehydrogenase B (NAD(+)), electron transfer subunit [Spirochaetia bacterium]
MPQEKKSLITGLLSTQRVSDGITRMKFSWHGAKPRAGQFFMVKPCVSSTFLARPISAAAAGTGSVTFFIAGKGRGTRELIDMRKGQSACLTGPLGNCWNDFRAGGVKQKNDTNRKIALVSGGVGIAPLFAFAAELSISRSKNFDFFAGFKERNTVLNVKDACIVTEDGSEGKKGLVTDYVDTSKYSAVYSCGPLPMMHALYNKCNKTNTPLFISMEANMACGVGACLGCTIKTINGNKRCCADGPVFPAGEIFYE